MNNTVKRKSNRVDSPFTRVAETLVDNGFCAIPIKPGEKRPGSYSNGNWYGDLDWTRFCNRLPTDIEMNIWTTWPDAGVCIALDHTIKVVDIDTDDPKKIEAILSVLPETDVVKRGEKGASYFYRGSDKITNRPFKIRRLDGYDEPILDLLAHGRQTVLPPTIHPKTGKAYEWVGTDTLLDVTVEDLPELPDDIADKLEEVIEQFGDVISYAKKPVNGQEIFGDTIWSEVNQMALANLDAWVPELPAEANVKRSRDGNYRIKAFWRGVENNNVGVHSTGIVDWGGGDNYSPIDLVMVAFGHPYFEYSFDWLREKIGYEPKRSEWDEYAKISIQNLIKKADYKSTKSRVLVVANDDEPPLHDNERERPEPASLSAPRSNMDPFTPEACGGLMGSIAKWSLETARRPVPEFAVMSAIGFLSALYGRRIVGPTGLGTNVYMAGLAKAGFGKEHPLESLKTIAVDCNMMRIIGPGEVTSGTSIEKVLRINPCMIMPWDELGIVLESVNGRMASSWSKSIRKVMLELYSKSTGIWSGKEHADPSRVASADPIFAPTLSLLGMSTPETFYEGITEASLADGFLARLTVIHAKERPDRQKAPALITTPPSLINSVKEALTELPVSNIASANAHNPSMRPTLYTVPWDSKAAEDKFYEIEDWQIVQIEEHGAQHGLIGRTGEQTLKYAALRAMSNNPRNPRVTVEDMDWGYAIVQRSIDCLEHGIENYMSGSPFQELCKTIKRHLDESKNGYIPMASLLRKKGVGIHDQRMVKSALDRLVEIGDIERPSEKNGGFRVTLVGRGD